MTREEAASKLGKIQFAYVGETREALDMAIGVLLAIEALQAEPVKHGEWETRKGIEYCSECNKSMMWQSNFCPNCGAKMDGGKDVY